MIRSKIYNENNIVATDFITKCMLVCPVLLIIVWILNYAGVFIVNQAVMTVSVLISSIFFYLPRLSLLFIKRDNTFIRYFSITCCTISVIILYVLLKYHVILLFAFPIVLSLLYFNSKLTNYTIIISLISIISSHLLGLVYNFIPDEPLTNLREVVIYGIIPRCIEYIGLAIICSVIGKRAQNMLQKVDSYSEEINRNKEGLNSIINVSRSLFGARELIDLASLVRYAVFTVAASIQGTITPPVAIVGVKNDKKHFIYLDNDLEIQEEEIKDDCITVTMSDIKFVFPINKQKVWDNIQISAYGIGMTFYDEYDKLLSYVAMQFKVGEDDELLNSSLDILYNNIKIAITNTKLNEDIFKAQESIILSFAEISESKSRQTGQHVKRVSEYTKIMSRYAGFSEERSQDIALAAMMHDIGKLMIPAEILEKPSRFTNEEFNVIKTHVSIGADLLKNSPGEVMTMAKAIALQHHERWDGKGYLGFKGEDIDFLSRYVSVADVFDALVSNRSYKKGWPPEEAYDEIVNQSEKQFAPEAVRIFKQCYPQILEILQKYPDDVAQSKNAQEATTSIVKSL